MLQKKLICFFSEMFVCLPIRQEQLPMVTAGDLSCNSETSACQTLLGKVTKTGKGQNR